ncbi:glycosyltransferase [Bavariicoccus seileri]|uniref:glycosyltransferase n=1 Tax=Bavariicoccus seileri TaxID=549685 RepID=UPI003F8F17C7
MGKPQINVVTLVVTYNRKALLEECLNALLEQSLAVDKLIVVDNDSTDGTNQLFGSGNRFDYPVIDYIKLPENSGGAGGFYEGIKYATENYQYEWLWLMDDDTIVYRDTLKSFNNALGSFEADARQDVSFLASTVFGPENEPMNVPVLDARRSANGYPDWYFNLADGLVKIESATFVSLLINGDAIQKIGYPCKDYFIWGDDTEYTQRLTKYYGPAYLVGPAKVLHKRFNTKRLLLIEEENENRIPMYYYLYRNALINYREYGSGLDFIKNIISIIQTIFAIGFKPGIKFRLKKIKVIFKGMFAYFFRRYDYEGFKNRMSVK